MAKITVFVDLGVLGEVEVLVEYDYSPGTPDVHYLRNGDPGYPGDPEELCINRVWHNHMDVSALFEEGDKFSDIVLDAVHDLEIDREADRADFEYDRRREDEAF